MVQTSGARPVTAKQAYSVDDLCREFPLSKGYWWSEIRRGALRVKRFGRRVLLMRKDLDSYLEGRESDGPTAA
jgi:hypothetical protein